MEILNFLGAVDQELREAYNIRKERFGIATICQTCPETCKQTKAEGLYLFYCHKSNMVDMNNLDNTESGQ